MNSSDLVDQLFYFIFCFDHLDALQIKQTPLLEMTLSRGTGFYSIFFLPSECYVKSYSSVFYFKVLVYEVSIKFYPLLTVATFDQQQGKKNHFYFPPQLFVFVLVCMCVCAMHKCE